VVPTLRAVDAHLVVAAHPAVHRFPPAAATEGGWRGVGDRLHTATRPLASGFSNLSSASASGLARKYVDSHHTVLSRGSFLARPAEWIETFPHLDILEADAAQHLNELSLRESAGDSTCP